MKNTIIPLPQTFDRGEFTCRVKLRDQDIVLVELSIGGRSMNHWEVAPVVKQPEWTAPNGKTYPAKEGLPGASVWGTYGWSYTDETQAYAKFRQLVDKRAAKRG